MRHRGLYCEIAGVVRAIDAEKDPRGDACRAAGGTVYLLVERDPLLRNNHVLQNHVLLLRTSSAWANPDTMPALQTDPAE